MCSNPNDLLTWAAFVQMLLQRDYKAYTRVMGRGGRSTDTAPSAARSTSTAEGGNGTTTTSSSSGGAPRFGQGIVEMVLGLDTERSRQVRGGQAVHEAAARQELLDSDADSDDDGGGVDEAVATPSSHSWDTGVDLLEPTPPYLRNRTIHALCVGVSMR